MPGAWLAGEGADAGWLQTLRESASGVWNWLWVNYRQELATALFVTAGALVKQVAHRFYGNRLAVQVTTSFPVADEGAIELDHRQG